MPEPKLRPEECQYIADFLADHAYEFYRHMDERVEDGETHGDLLIDKLLKLAQS